jgi:hypothetical protein
LTQVKKKTQEKPNKQIKEKYADCNSRGRGKINQEKGKKKKKKPKNKIQLRLQTCASRKTKGPKNRIIIMWSHLSLPKNKIKIHKNKQINK